ncbi:MAG: indolepyruvate ferredoxin oxidoreductase [Pseudohongiellaceae bacterium]
MTSFSPKNTSSFLKDVSLDDKYKVDTTRAYMTGIEALVRLPILQHQRDQERGLNTAGFISGYRGSPLGTLDMSLWKASKFLNQHNINFVPGVNEDLAATAVWGSQQVNLFEGAKYDGVFGMWYGKGPGVDRSMDAIRHANAFGTSKYGGVLAIAGDDHAAKSSTLPHQSEHMFIGASIPVLNPSNVQEVLDLGIYGWELSRYCGAWVAMKAITENMDSAISAEIDPNRVQIVIPDTFEMPSDGVHARWPDNALDQERRLNKYKIYAAREFARVNGLNKIVLDSDRARLGIITTGKAYLDVMQALEDLGIDAAEAGKIGLRVFKVGMSWPLDPVGTHEFAEGLEEIIVVEEKRSIIEDQLTGQLYNWPTERRPRVIGEYDTQGNDLLTNLSELTPAMIARAIAKRISLFHTFVDANRIEQRLAFYDNKESLLALPRATNERIPHYCSGCPHSQSTRIPEGSRALGGIGCHYMGTWEIGDRKADTFTQMGGEGATWIGQAAFTETQHVFQNIGDGTYFHSGTLAIRQAIAAGVNITYKILYNEAVAMTGGQSVDGNLSIAQLIMQLRGEGIQRIALLSDNPAKHNAIELGPGLTISSRDDLIAIEEELREIKGTSILIFDQTCAAEKRRLRRKGVIEDPAKRVFINSAVCEGCGDCGTESNCLSVVPKESELGRKRQIDQSSCNKDYSCVRGFCPSFVTVIGGELNKPTPTFKLSDLGQLPLPTLPSVERQPWNILVAGVGGTGVLTISAVIAMAAHLEGKGCATMNQTGLAQKFGAVVSHVRIAQKQEAINAVRIAAGDADLLIGCDLSVAAESEAIAKLHNQRSHCVINDFAAVSGELISNPDLKTSSQNMKALLNAEAKPQSVDFIQATQLATQLLGDSIASNMFLLGYALQKGLVPVSVEALQAAIELNAVAVQFNLKALEWGRHAAVDISRVNTAVSLEAEFKALSTLPDIAADRHQRLKDYQSITYAQAYQRRIEQLQQVELSKGLSDTFELSKAAAKSLYKLMAVKDEYEVARLYSNGDFAKQLAKQFSGDFKVEYHLAPPLITRKDKSGKLRKRKFPGAMLFLFRLLAKLRFLRGTAFDIFAYQGERREEQDTLADYLELLDQLEREVSSDNYRSAVELAALPLEIRGYGHIKSANRVQVQSRQQHLLKIFRGELVPLAERVEVAA